MGRKNRQRKGKWHRGGLWSQKLRVEGFGCAHHRVRRARNSQLSPRITCRALTRCFVASRVLVLYVMQVHDRKLAMYGGGEKASCCCCSSGCGGSQDRRLSVTATWRLSRQPISDAWTTSNRSIPSRFFFFLCRELIQLQPHHSRTGGCASPWPLQNSLLRGQLPRRQRSRQIWSWE